MARTLFIIAALVLVYLIIKNRNVARRPEQTHDAGARRQDQLVQCAQCGVRVPSSEAVTAGDQQFCCPQHQRDWQKQHPH